MQSWGSGCCPNERPSVVTNTAPDPPAGGLSGKVALVTGAAQGIGLCIAQFMARDGAATVLADIQSAKAAAAAAALCREGLRAAACAIDITRTVSIQAAVAEVARDFGAIDVLVNNAGIDSPPGVAWELDDEHWRTIIDTDLTGAWLCSKAVIPDMIRRGGGRIVFISSLAALRGSQHISVAYNAAKAGLLGLTIGLSAQLERHRIRVNAITPGPTGTGRPMDEQARRAQDAEFPLGLGGPEPIAHACLYLARSSGDWVSGSILNVSGGRWRG